MTDLQKRDSWRSSLSVVPDEHLCRGWRLLQEGRQGHERLFEIDRGGGQGH
jgi:hypothetical protein